MNPIDPDLFDEDILFADAADWSLDELDGCADTASIRSVWTAADDLGE